MKMTLVGIPASFDSGAIETDIQGLGIVFVITEANFD